MELEVYVPQAPTVGATKRVRLADRVGSLNGKRVGLLWNHKARGDVALAAIGEELTRRFSGVHVLHLRGTNPTNDEVLREGARTCDVIIGSTAD